MADDLRKWLNNPSTIHSLYYVIGEEAFLIQKVRKAFYKLACSEEEVQDFNRDEFEGSELTLEKLQSATETLSLLAQKRLIFCNHAEKITEKKWNEIDSVIQSLPEFCTLIFFFKKVDKRKKFFKTLKSKGHELIVEQPKEWEMEKWIDFLSQEAGLEFSKEVKVLFQQLVGVSLMDMKNEMQKIKSYLGDRSVVSEKDLFAIVSRVKVESIFDLTRAIGEKDLVRSLDCLARLLDQNQSDIGVMALVARHIRILSRIREGQKQGFTKNKIQAFAGVPPYFMKDYLNQVDLWSDEHILETIKVLHETDKAIKFSPMSSHIWLENFLLKVCSA